jgi:uncharacterized membrane protein
MKDEYKGWAVAVLLLIALLIAQVTNYVDNKHKQTIIKTNIGEFMLRDGKMYGVYELSRDNQGNMVAR